LGLNDLGRVRLRLAAPLVFDSYRRNRATGAVILIDEASNETAAAGVILDVEAERALEETARRRGGKRPNVEWQGSRLTRARRWEALGHRGATVWLTGLPGAGKTTIALALEERLVTVGRHALLLDGDNLRHGLNGDLGFDEAGRRENVRRTAQVARLVAESGALALVSLVSRFAEDRAAAAELHEQEELDFLEVFVSTPLALCEERDPKGHYPRARAGELFDFTGVDARYERPSAPALVLAPATESVDEEVERVMEELSARGLI
jgi:bifunctional enzyme CysN/CysC